MRQQPETSAKVLIQHDKDSLLNEEHKMVKIQAIFSVVSKPQAMNTVFQQPQLNLTYAKGAGGLVCGCENIYKKLHSLNEDVRGGQQVCHFYTQCSSFPQQYQVFYPQFYASVISLGVRVINPWDSPFRYYALIFMTNKARKRAREKSQRKVSYIYYKLLVLYLILESRWRNSSSFSSRFLYSYHVYWCTL